MVWSDGRRSFAGAHFKRLGAVIFVLFFLTAICFEIGTYFWKNTHKQGSTLLLLKWIGSMMGVFHPEMVFAWGALVGTLFSRYFLLDARVGVKSQPSVLISMLVVLINAFFGAAIGAQFAERSSKRPPVVRPRNSPSWSDSSLDPLLCNYDAVYSHLVFTGAVACMLSCVHFAWSNRNELTFLSIASEPQSVKLVFLKSLRTEIVASVTGSIALAVALWAGSTHKYLQKTVLSEWFVWVFKLPAAAPTQACSAVPSIKLVLLTFSCSCMTMFLVDFGTVLLKTFITIPLNFETLARTTDREGVTEQVLLLSALWLGKEQVLSSLHTREAELSQIEQDQLQRISGKLSHQKPPLARVPTWEAEVDLQRFGIELLAKDLQGKGWGRVPHIGRFESNLFLWEQVARISAVQYLSYISALPDRQGLHKREMIYKTIWPDCLRVCLLNIDALNLQVQAFASRANRTQCRNFQGIPWEEGIEFIPEEILRQFGALDPRDFQKKRDDTDWERRIPMIRTLREIPFLLRRKLGMYDRHPHLKHAQVEYVIGSIETATKLLSSAAREHPLSRCHNLVPVVLNSFAGCFLSIECLYSCICEHETQTNKEFSLPELDHVWNRLQEGLYEISKKYKGSLNSFTFPEKYAERLNLIVNKFEGM